MQQLTGLDATFLSLETANAPMHIGGLAILDPETRRGRFDFDALRTTGRKFSNKFINCTFTKPEFLNLPGTYFLTDCLTRI